MARYCYYCSNYQTLRTAILKVIVQVDLVIHNKTIVILQKIKDLSNQTQFVNPETLQAVLDSKVNSYFTLLQTI